jgi:cytochrome P450
VRYVSPVMTFMRTVTEDHTYRGVDLHAGDRVFLLYQSANRDETAFDDPDEFRVDRDPNPHLGFGIGTHYCLGANLARAEISVVFTELFSRLRDIRAVDPSAIDRGDSSLVLAMKHLPAVFTPEGRT